MACTSNGPAIVCIDRLIDIAYSRCTHDDGIVVDVDTGCNRYTGNDGVGIDDGNRGACHASVHQSIIGNDFDRPLLSYRCGALGDTACGV